MIKLTEQQIHELDQSKTVPPRVVNPFQGDKRLFEGGP